MSDVVKMTAARIAEAIRSPKVSCEEVIRAYIERIEEVNLVVGSGQP